MEKCKSWVFLEWKRVIYKLPVILGKIAIFVMLTGMAILCGRAVLEKQQEKTFILGYVAENDELTGGAIEYFTNLDSVENWCVFQKIEQEDHGLVCLMQHEIDALLVMPKEMIESILSGENLQPTLYVSNEVSIHNALFQTLEQAGVSMLQTAQSQIYTAYALGAEELCSMINENNLSLVAQREELFYHEKVSAGKGIETGVYYKAVGVLLFLLIFPLFFTEVLCRETKKRIFIWKRAGISLWLQVLNQIVIMTAIILGIGSILMLFFGELHLTQMLLFAFAVSAYVCNICTLFYERKYAIVCGVLLLLMQAYVGGCILPDILINDRIQIFARFLPIYIWKNWVFSWICKTQLAKNSHMMMMVWTVFFSFLQFFILKIQCLASDKGVAFGEKDGHGIRKNNDFRSKPFWMIILQKYCCNVKLLVALCIPILLIHGLEMLERTGENTIHVGIYDTEGIWQDSFTEKNGKIQYHFYDDVETMERDVYRENIICGFSLPQDLVLSVINHEATWSIRVYEPESAMITRAIEEEIYATIFERVSNTIFEEQIYHYLGNHTQKMETAGAFEINVKYMDTQQKVLEEQEPSQKITIYLLKRATRAILGIICLVYGFFQMQQDHRLRYYNRGKWHVIAVEGVLTIFIYILIAGLI